MLNMILACSHCLKTNDIRYWIDFTNHGNTYYLYCRLCDNQTPELDFYSLIILETVL